jgi:hypothetical protein
MTEVDKVILLQKICSVPVEDLEPLRERLSSEIYRILTFLNDRLGLYGKELEIDLVPFDDYCLPTEWMAIGRDMIESRLQLLASNKERYCNDKKD